MLPDNQDQPSQEYNPDLAETKSIGDVYLQERRSQIYRAEIVTEMAGEIASEGLNSGFEKGPKKSLSVRRSIQNCMDQTRLVAVDLMNVSR